MSLEQHSISSSTQGGFSLLEIAIALGIMGIVTALAVSTFRSGVGNPGLASQVREVHAMFDAARSHAVKTNTPTCVALRTGIPNNENRNQCSTEVEYFYSLSRSETLECSVFNFQNPPSDVQVHRKNIEGLAYRLSNVDPYLTIGDCPFYYIRTFTFQPGSGFLKSGSNDSISSFFGSNSGFVEFFNPDIKNTNKWRFRVERSGVLTLSSGE